MTNYFANQVAIVTGASSGIGWEMAKALALNGARVGVVARRKDKLDELTGQIHATGGVTAAASADVGNQAEVESAVRAIATELGPVDLLIANAGVGTPTLIDPLNVSAIEKMVRVNVLGVVYPIAAVLPEMLERKHGHLAAVSSVAAYKGIPGESGYCSSKAAVSTFMEGLRIQLRGRGIYVTTICPGFIRTPMTAVNQFHMPFLLEADEAARRIVRALARRRKVYDFPWPTAVLMNLTRWLPDWVMERMMQDYNENPPMSDL